jgi:hypothetical protein
MTNFTIKKAERKQAKLRIGFAAPSGAGKTYSALLLARGIATAWDKICVIDTEHGSAELYSDLGDYNVITLTAKTGFQPDNYADAIKAAEDAGMEVIILDSLSHAWNEEGGLLDQADKRTSGGGNRFTVWADLTPQHRRLVNAMLQSDCHIIGTMRSKQEYALEKDEKTGKSTVKKLGMAPVQRDGMEYEFTTFFDIDINHYATASKDRTGLFAKKPPFTISEETGQMFKEWNMGGKVDINGLKKSIFNQMKNRLEIELPAAEDQVAFFRNAIPKLTGLEMNEKNLVPILAALQAITDKEWAKKTAWGETEKDVEDTVIEPVPEEVIIDIL